MQRKEALRRVVFLKTLPEAIIEALAAASRERRLAKGEMLFAENDHCLGLVVVLTGAVKIYKMDERGRELTLGREGPGGSVIELPLFDGGNYPAAAEAAEGNTTVLVIARDRFLAVMAACPGLAEQALRAMAIRMRKLMHMLEAQTLHSVRARLAAYLLQAAHDQNGFLLEETNEAIGSQIGTVRDVVSRTLRSFHEDGLIQLRGRWVTIAERAALQRAATSAGG